jgi:hypothetical protein
MKYLVMHAICPDFYACSSIIGALSFPFRVFNNDKKSWRKEIKQNTGERERERERE